MLHLAKHMAKRTAPDDVARAIQRVADEVIRTFHHLRDASERFHGGGKRSASRRGVLCGLARSGPQTVPQMAKERPVSRQFIQHLVDELYRQGLVEILPNPDHARSHLIGLTPAGIALAAEIERVEGGIYRRIARRFTREDLERVAGTLTDLRSSLDEITVGVDRDSKET